MSKRYMFRKLTIILTIFNGLSLFCAAALYMAGSGLMGHFTVPWQVERFARPEQAFGFAIIYLALCLVGVKYWSAGRGWCQALLLYLACMHVISVAYALAAQNLLFSDAWILGLAIFLDGVIFAGVIRGSRTRHPSPAR